MRAPRPAAAAAATLAITAAAACSSSASHAPHAPMPSSRIDRYVALTRAAFGPVGRDLTRRELIADGRTYCSTLRTGTYTYRQVLDRLTATVARSGVDASQARVVLDLAVATFCPDQKP